jgi:hypothetical protein
MAYQTPHNLDLYFVVRKNEMKSIDVEYQVQVGYWVAKNHLQRLQNLCNNDLYV